MTDNHPITPPPELVAQIRSDALRKSSDVLDYELRMIHAAYRAGADQELEACCEWLRDVDRWKTVADRLRLARRPKPPSLKKQALDAWDRLKNEAWCEEIDYDLDIIRHALEKLND